MAFNFHAVVDDVSDWAAGDDVTCQVEKSERLVSLVKERDLSLVTKTPFAPKGSSVPPPFSLSQSDDITVSGAAACVVSVELSGVVFSVISVADLAANLDRPGVIGVALSSLPKEETTLDGIFCLAVGD